MCKDSAVVDIGWLLRPLINVDDENEEGYDGSVCVGKATILPQRIVNSGSW